MEQVKRFWRWWMSELASFVPLADPRIFAHRRLPLEIHLGETGAALYRRQSLRAPLSQANRIADAASFSELFPASRLKGRAVLSFDDKLALRKSMPLSRALYSEADAIIASEIARTTPFKPGQTLGLWHEREAGQIEYAVIRQADVHGAKDTAWTNGIQIEAIAFRPAQQQSWPQIRGLNGLLWQSTTDRRWRTIAISCLLVALFTSCAFAIARNAEQSSFYDSLSARIDEVRPKAVERRKEIDVISARISAFSAMVRSREDKPRLVDVWVALVRVLPDDTWLQALTFRDDKIQIEGIAKNAEALISRVENSQAFRNAKFTAPVVDQQSAGSRFVMSFEIEGEP